MQSTCNRLQIIAKPSPVRDAGDGRRRAAETNVEKVDHPAHYNQAGIECIAAIRAALTSEEYEGFCKGNAVKYIWREKYKGGTEDIKKALWYLNALVKSRDATQPEA